MQDNRVKCTRDHPRYNDLQVAITELLLKDRHNCTPSTLKRTHKELCDLFQEKSFANQVSSTKRVLTKQLEEQNINLGDKQRKQPQHKQPQEATAGSPIYEGGKYKPKYILWYLYLLSHISSYFIIKRRTNRQWQRRRRSQGRRRRSCPGRRRRRRRFQRHFLEKA